MKSNSRMLAGILLIAVGIIFFLKVLGILNFSIWRGFSDYWPVGLILAGTAMIYRMKWLALTFLFLTLLFGGLYALSSIEVGEPREIVKEIPLDNITTLDLSIGFGAGDLNIGEGDGLRYEIKTSDTLDPEVVAKKSGDKAIVNIERRGDHFPFWNKIKDEWNIQISPELVVDLELDFGATDAEIDLKNLQVRNLDMDTGATSTTVVFGEFPTKVDLDTGASSIDFKFPESMGVVIDVDGGAISTNLDGFSKKDGKHYSDNYDENKDNIEITIDAGATSIDGEFY